MIFPYAMLGAAAGAFIGQAPNPLVPPGLFIIGVATLLLTNNEQTEIVKLADNKIKVEP